MREPDFRYFDNKLQIEGDHEDVALEGEEYFPEDELPRVSLKVLPPVDEDDDDEFDETLLPHELVDEIEARDFKLKGLSFTKRLTLLFSSVSSALYDVQMRRRGVRLVRQRVQMSGGARNAPPLRAAFISDLHYGPTSGRTAGRQAWRLLHEAKPDIVLLGGDYLYTDHSGLPTLMRELQRWKWDKPRCGIFAILGNDDYECDTEALVATLEACGVTVLRNEAVPLPEPWNGIWLAGIDDMRNGQPDIEQTLADVPRDASTIMLSHSPDVCAHEALKRCRLTLCGHTHGGQFCMPNGDPIYTPGEWGKQFSWGLHRHCGNWVFVSRGVGIPGLPFRLFAPPDVALFEIACSGGGVAR